MKRLAILLCLFAVTLVGCGGGGSGSGGGIPIPPSNPSLVITTSTLPPGIVGQPYSTTLSASGGTPPYKWTAQNLADYTLSQDGVLSGTLPANSPGMAGTIQVQVTDAAGKSAAKFLTLDIFGLSPTQFLVPQVKVDFTPFNFVIVNGGIEPIQWQVSGTLPTGLTFKKNPASTDTRQYQLVGTPTQAGTYTFTITARDSGSPTRSLSRDYTVQVEPEKLNISVATLPPAVVGTPYSYRFTTTGGTGPFLFDFRATSQPYSLPAGMTFDNNTGVLSGTPTTPGYLKFSVYVTDSSIPTRQQKGWEFYWLLITPVPISAHNDSIANAVPIYPGEYTASISPLRDSSGNLAADQDFYQATAPAGSTIFVSVLNRVFRPGTIYTPPVLDPVLEIVDANGHRLNSCNDPLDDNPPSGTPLPLDPTPGGFDDPCMNWPGSGTPGVEETAILRMKVPGSSGNTTFYIHVFDWRGDARPDMLYTLSYAQQ